jgi:hypothetical protein
MMAGVECASCLAQILGPWTKDPAKGAGQNEHRDAAIEALGPLLSSHECDPERVKALEENGPPVPFAPAWTPNNPPKETVHE